MIDLLFLKISDNQRFGRDFYARLQSAKTEKERSRLIFRRQQSLGKSISLARNLAWLFVRRVESNKIAKIISKTNVFVLRVWHH